MNFARTLINVVVLDILNNLYEKKNCFRKKSFPYCFALRRDFHKRNFNVKTIIYYKT